MAKQDWPDWELYVRDGAICVYCGLDGKIDLRYWRQLQIDHVVPVKHGGADCDSNKVVSCTRCNSLKGTSDPRTLLEHDGDVPRSVLIAAARTLIAKAGIQQDELRDYAQMMMEILGEKRESS